MSLKGLYITIGSIYLAFIAASIYAWVADKVLEPVIATAIVGVMLAVSIAAPTLWYRRKRKLKGSGSSSVITIRIPENVDRVRVTTEGHGGPGSTT